MPAPTPRDVAGWYHGTMQVLARSPDPSPASHGNQQDFADDGAVTRAVRLRDSVLAIVAHDLRTPLSTINMAAALLYDLNEDARHRHFIDIIRKAAQQAEVLLQDLVDGTRIEAGTLRIDAEPAMLRHVLKSVLESFEPQAQAARIVLTCDVARAHDAVVRVDAGRIVQVLSNLLSNALKFTPEGGRVHVGASLLGDRVFVSVSDTGVGIAQEEIAHVFERFWQADHHHRAGAGLGLAIARGIVEAHGGEIGVTSEPGAGATFYFTLPLA